MAKAVKTEGLKKSNRAASNLKKLKKAEKEEQKKKAETAAEEQPATAIVAKRHQKKQLFMGVSDSGIKRLARKAGIKKIFKKTVEAAKKDLLEDFYPELIDKMYHVKGPDRVKYTAEILKTALKNMNFDVMGIHTDRDVHLNKLKVAKNISKKKTRKMLTN